MPDVDGSAPVGPSSTPPAPGEAISQTQVRGRMLEIIEFFLAGAVALGGVQRVAVIDSITTPQGGAKRP